MTYTHHIMLLHLFSFSSMLMFNKISSQMAVTNFTGKARDFSVDIIKLAFCQIMKNLRKYIKVEFIIRGGLRQFSPC